jgi:hypothetical protein
MILPKITNNSMVPGILDGYQWDTQGRRVVDVTLYSTLANERMVSAMNLSLTGVSLINAEDISLTIIQFNSSLRLKLHRLTTGKYIETVNLRLSERHDIVKVRFHLSSDEQQLIHHDKRTSFYEDLDYIDFDMAEEFPLLPSEGVIYRLRFDFPEFKKESLISKLIKAYASLLNEHDKKELATEILRA